VRRLAAYWYQGKIKQRIGTLLEAPRGLVVFEWDRDFLLTPIELSPLNFAKSPEVVEFKRDLFEGLPGLFADSVPDGWGKILLKRGLDKSGVTTSALSPLDALAYIGDSGMGALSFAPEMREPNEWADGKVSLSELEKGIKPILEGTASKVLETFIANGASPNGARPKIILKESNGKFYSANSSVKGDEWLIKFKATSDPQGIGRLEYVYSEMARRSGLNMPETRLFKSEGKFYFGVKRFDRVPEGRIHVHTLSGLLHVNPGNFSIDYNHYAKVAQMLTNDVREVEKVIRLAAFNILACNQDDHAKNVAFTMSQGGEWRVAPAYDLTYHVNPFKEHKMLLNGEGRPTEKNLLAFSQSFGISARKSKILIDQVKEGVSTFKELASEFDIPKALVKEVSAAIEPKKSRE